MGDMFLVCRLIYLYPCQSEVIHVFHHVLFQTAEYLIASYKYGSFTKVSNFLTLA